MDEFLFAAASLILITGAVGLFRVLSGPAEADRMMAAQLVGTGGVAVLLLISAATHMPPVVDVAVMLALLAAFASIGFVNSGSPPSKVTEQGDGR